MRITPAITAPLDPGFQPAAVFDRNYVKHARTSGRAVPLVIGLEREGGLLSRYETIGVYLGYAIPHYAEFYDFRHILIIGRVTTGAGGDVILGEARRVLEKELPELAAKIELHVPEEKSRRVGQAVAANSLPVIKK